jgi:hypothetical protein
MLVRHVEGIPGVPQFRLRSPVICLIPDWHGRQTDTRDSEAVHWGVTGVHYPGHMVFTREDTRKTLFAKTIVTCPKFVTSPFLIRAVTHGSHQKRQHGVTEVLQEVKSPLR